MEANEVRILLLWGLSYWIRSLCNSMIVSTQKPIKFRFLISDHSRAGAT